MDSQRDAVGEIKGKIDLVEFVSQYLPLKKTGINYLGLCPFHDEKTPSFTVSPERQTFKCFGCGRGGDVFSFMMEKEGVTFPEALNLLADKTGVVLPKRSLAAPTGPNKNRLFELNEQCAYFWHELLLKHAKAKTARDYLEKTRGLSLELIKKFRLGFAPPPATTKSWLAKNKFTEAETRLAGEPARFADRIIFPLTDITGRVIGFTGRLLPNPEADLREPTGPKYWNTPETPLFKKSEALYGLDLAKESIRKTGTAIIAEGQMDVIGLVSVGLTNTVASSGTALTDQQVKILARFATELTFAYDADAAGLAAAERGFSIALKFDLNPTVMPIPKGEDPGSLAQKKPETLKRAYEQRQPIIAWLLQNAVGEHGTAQPGAKKAITKKVLPWIAQVPDAVERRAWLDTVADQIKTNVEALNEELNKIKSPPASPAPSTTSPDSPDSPVSTPLELLMGLVAQHPSLIAETPHLDRLTAGTPWEEINQHLAASSEKRPTLDRETEIRMNEAVMLTEKEYGPLGLNEVRAEIKTLLKRVISFYNQTVRARLQQAITAAEEQGEKEKTNSLMSELKSATITEDN